MWSKGRGVMAWAHAFVYYFLSQLAGGPEIELPLGHVRFYPLAR